MEHGGGTRGTVLCVRRRGLNQGTQSSCPPQPYSHDKSMVFPAACFEAIIKQVNPSPAPHGLFIHLPMGCLHTSSDYHKAFRIPTHGGRNCMSCGGHTEPSPCASPQFQSVAGGEILRLASLAQDDREEDAVRSPSPALHCSPFTVHPSLPPSSVRLIETDDRWSSLRGAGYPLSVPPPFSVHCSPFTSLPSVRLRFFAS